jgi:hypothetical protein
MAFGFDEFLLNECPAVKELLESKSFMMKTLLMMKLFRLCLQWISISHS